MDLLVVIVLPLEHLLFLISFTFQRSQAIQFSTSRYSYSKDFKEEAKYRRQFPRKLETISLKPPPEDWPEPVAGAADFVVINKKVEVTSLSPLDIYQAKLEKEFVKQQEKNTKRLKEELTEESPIGTSSEEEIKRLLDPDELLKHNKELRPLVNKNINLKAGGKIKSATKQSRGIVKPAPIKSLTALKAKKTKTKTKSAISKLTTKSSRRGRKRKNNIQDKYAKELTPPKELINWETTAKDDPEEKPVKIKRQKKKARAFTFATNYLQTSKDESINIESKPQNSRKYKSTLLKEVITTATSKTTKGKKKVPVQVKTLASKSTKKGMKMPEEDSTTLEESTCKLTTEHNRTTRMMSIGKTNSTYPTTKSMLITELPTINKRQEIKNKHDKIRQEMKKIVVEEQLEGSFSDLNWTSSQEIKIPIINITPRQTLMEILKYKVMSYIETIIRGSQKLLEE